MRPSRLLIAMSVAASANVMAAEAPNAAATTPAFAFSYNHPVAGKELPQNAEQWLARMSDFTKNGSAFKDARTFVAWFDAVTEPNFYVTMMTQMQEPKNWAHWFETMADPKAYQNYMMFADPVVWTGWMAASMDPNFYTALFAKAFDPNKWVRWAVAPVDAKNWAPILKTLDPNLYVKWMLAPMDVNNYGAAFKAMDPNTYVRWGTVMADPKSYGTWGAFMDPKTYGNLAAAFDPNAVTSWLFVTPANAQPAGEKK
jgi:hypothetical protein